MRLIVSEWDYKITVDAESDYSKTVVSSITFGFGGDYKPTKLQMNSEYAVGVATDPLLGVMRDIMLVYGKSQHMDDFADKLYDIADAVNGRTQTT